MAAPEHHQALTAISKAFLERMGFRGLIGIEYKRDARDGQFYLIEPTVYRTDYQHEVAALNGSDWLHAAYLDMLEQSIPPDRPYQQSQSWVDFPASRYSTQAAPPRDQPGRHCSPNDAHFRWSDPLPGLMHYARFLKTSVVSRLGKT
jgi:D-aspartate ligase